MRVSAVLTLAAVWGQMLWSILCQDKYNFTIDSLAPNDNLYLAIDSSDCFSTIPKSHMLNLFSAKWPSSITPITIGRLPTCADSSKLLTLTAGRGVCSLTPQDFLDGNTTESSGKVASF